MRQKSGVVFIAVLAIGLLTGLVFSLINDSDISYPDVPVSPRTPITPSDDKSIGIVNADDEADVAFNSDFTSLFTSIAAAPTTEIGPQVSKIKPSSPIKRTKIAPTNQNVSVVINNTEYPLRAYQALLTPNDPSATQWWTGSTELSQSWDISTGSSITTIAIIDTGFALSHEEFAGRWHQNTGEIGIASNEAPSRLNCSDQGLPISAGCNLVDDDLDGIVDNETGGATYQNPSKRNCTALFRPISKDCNNVDDDGNGYVDDVTGWDFMNQDSSVQAGQLNPTGSGTTHGTMVTGVAAATGNNGRGIAGVNWGAKILPIQALDDDGYGDTVSVGQSIYYAIDQGVDIISISLGTQFNDVFVREAIEAATKAGIIVVAASGNDGCDCMSYPARYPEVVAVGANTSANVPASFSSWGSELDVLAPGNDIRTSTWTPGNNSSAYVSGVAGTSFATPYVAGLLATMKSLQPESTPLQLIAGLGESTTKPGGMTSRPLDSRYGFGLTNALAANRRMSIPKTDLQVYRFTPVQTGSFLLGNSSYEASGTYSAHYCVDGTGSTPIFELTKPGAIFYSLSRIEAYKAQSQGYAVNRFTYACMQQNHDSYQLARLIDIFKEFRNDYTIR